MAPRSSIESELAVWSGVVDDHDAIWKPGYDGPPPEPSPPVESLDEPPVEPPVETQDDPRDDHTVRRRGAVPTFAVAAAVAAVVVVAGALVVLDPFASSAPGQGTDGGADVVGPPDRSVFGGTEDRRLPRTATELWTVDLDDVGDHWAEVIGRELVVVAVERSGAAGSEESNAALLALDALTGAQRWTLPLSAGPSEVAVVGSVDDLLVVEQPGDPGPTVIGVDMATGEARWTTNARPNLGHVGLRGTRFVARLPSPPDRFVSLIDASSGNEVGEIASDPAADGHPGGWITDGGGIWYSIVDGEILALDLTSELVSPTTVGELDAGPVTPVVVGDRIVAVDDAGSIVLVEPDGRRSVMGSSVPSPARSLTPVSGSDFVVTAPGAIAGVVVDGDAVTVAWQRAGGAEVGYHPIEGGTLLQVATRGGAAIELVDAASGDTIEQLVMVPGVLQALVVAGDGVVVLRRAALGTRVAGVDLDGTERWSILGAEPVIVGDRIVVRAAAGAAGLRLTTYGDAD